MSLISFHGMSCSIPLEFHHSIGMLIYIYICECVQVNIACDLGGGGNSLYRSLSTGRGLPFKGKHFKCRVYTDGWLSFEADRLKKANLWLV